MVASSILDHNGRPIERQALSEPQTARLAQLHREWSGHPVRGLTPAKLAALLEEAEQGDLTRQAELYLDMEERDPHLFAEMSKRRRALLGLRWSIEAPAGATPQEVRATETLSDLIQGLPDLEDLMLDALDALGHGYAAIELTWGRLGGQWLPTRFDHRPPTWFVLDKATRTQLRLRDNSPDGAEPWPFGWILHRHQARSGYLARSGLYRVCAWPWIMRQFSLRDLAEFLEIYGLPAKIGKYQSGAEDAEKATLYRAVQGLGRLAAGIMPKDMEIEFLQAAEGQADPFMAMVEYSDRAISKAVLGQTLSADAQPTGLGSGVASLHGEVRRDLLVSDARQLAGTLTRQLLYPIAALNGLAMDPNRSPRWVFDTSETEDLALFSDALTKLVDVGVPISVAWARERLGIPEPEKGEPLLGAPPDPLGAKAPPTPPPPVGAASAAPFPGPIGAKAPPTASQGRDLPDYAEQQAAALDAAVSPLLAALLGQVRRELEQAPDLAAFRARIDALYPELRQADLTALLGQSFAAADLAGRYDLTSGQ